MRGGDTHSHFCLHLIFSVEIFNVSDVSCVKIDENILPSCLQ